jgi:hypothetical protein
LQTIRVTSDADVGSNGLGVATPKAAAIALYSKTVLSQAVHAESVHNDPVTDDTAGAGGVVHAVNL